MTAWQSNVDKNMQPLHYWQIVNYYDTKRGINARPVIEATPILGIMFDAKVIFMVDKKP